MIFPPEIVTICRAKFASPLNTLWPKRKERKKKKKNKIKEGKHLPIIIWHVP
jgi:hypothetical protein